MLNVLKLNAEWLKELLTLEDYKTFALLDCCAKIGFFDLLSIPRSVDEISAELKLNTKAVKAICEFLKFKNLLIENNGKFSLSEVSRTFLTSDSPYSILSLFEDKREEISIWLNLEGVLKGENKRKESEFFKRRIIYLGKMSLLRDLKIVFKIAEYKEFREAKKLLDLGGGHGLYAYAFTLLNEDLEATVFDLPEVVRSAKEFISPFSPERLHFVEGDFFKNDLGYGYDLIFSSFNPGGKRAELIPKIQKALNLGGIYVNRQFFPKEDFNLEDLEWNLWGFEGLKKGFKAYTFEGDLGFNEYLSKLRDFGFEIMDVFGENERVIVAKRVE
ncbi:MAG: methyltransferase [Archaeoglobaceae archaeon]|nr:methyltransferase [Archaeoglobaceae archaeon]MDW8117837.1 methyltransferase [Archaeoglobaceae archaeon]